jgi:hypothetical protein
MTREVSRRVSVILYYLVNTLRLSQQCGFLKIFMAVVVINNARYFTQYSAATTHGAYYCLNMSFDRQ